MNIHLAVLFVAGELPANACMSRSKAAPSNGTTMIAAMIVIRQFLILGHIEHRESEIRNVPVFQINIGALDFIPMVDRSIGVTNEIFVRDRRRVRDSPSC